MSEKIISDESNKNIVLNSFLKWLIILSSKIANYFLMIYSIHSSLLPMDTY